jgi:hypothetical protein
MKDACISAAWDLTQKLIGTTTDKPRALARITFAQTADAGVVPSGGDPPHDGASASTGRQEFGAISSQYLLARLRR